MKVPAGTQKGRRQPDSKKPPKPPKSPKPQKAALSEEQAELVGELLEKMKGQMKSENFKGTLGDFIRLLQLQRELAQDRPGEIKVTWVEPSEEEPKS